ncbi:EF hand domain protein [Aspergillus clavatus NRRL 1]|uniref:EF hand domain protein n=1 Tax=Aspergillus clavatus (strain ATCC 1007 / CBS 513.65 / DSM 816 / NCTC 3887 / NRRL 1 / QM 1276 / 107) TaxID=344612 RepID=A1CT20_ASPCL|nr:EF hand domain protein [Aspergillus clavatus NRRL 1]EAW06457.1 EF hand domain protein [Aspergillus clavatus NRRL 1]
MPASQSRPVSLTRYRPALYLLTGVAAAYAIVYIHNNVLFPSAPQTPLRRRRAVRRRRNDPDESDVFGTPSYRAIAHLEQLERQNGVYGTFRIETEDGRRVESGLLPSLLATRDQLMEEVGVPQAHAERMREMMEETFLESFLALDFPPTHTVEEGSAERNYLMEQLQRRGISRVGIERALARFNEDINYGEDLRRRRQNGERVTLSTSTFPEESTPPQNMDGGETVVDDQSVFSWREGNNETSSAQEGQNLLNLLYHIAEDQARRDGYIHRGVTCNSCGAMPIQGIRYRCANCIDYDLCETCEAMQVHIKTHLFYKVRIPAPFLGNPRQSQPIWYPGKPAMLPRSLPRSFAKRLMKETGFENTELDALWDQFRCLASYEWADDPNKLYMAIDRKTFDRCFVPSTSVRPPPPCLIYDRMFSFYDTNNDGLIGFEEFLKGLASLNNKSNDERLRRVFRGYDIDGDGYVERKDFLRIFRAYYALSRELTRDMVAGMEDDFLEGGARDVVLGSQPISSAFPGSIPAGEPSRSGEGKRLNAEGDMVIADNEGVLRQDGADTGDRHAVVADAAARSHFLRETGTPMSSDPTRHQGPRDIDFNGTGHGEDEDDASSDEDASSSSIVSNSWPAAEHVLPEDVVNALGAAVPFEEVTDPVDRARVSQVAYSRMGSDWRRREREARRQGIDERWRRRAFYTDVEDGATTPEDYESDPDVDDLSDEDGALGGPSVLDSHPPSPRSRSSSKVRFEDDLTEDYDVRSNPSTSSRSIPVGERWGGFEIPEVERDVGKEILYQVTQQGFNELLDILFKPKEDLLMEAYRTRTERKIWAREIELAEMMDPKKQSAHEGGQESRSLTDESLQELLDRSGYSLRSSQAESVQPGPVLSPSPVLRSLDDDVRPDHLADPEEDAESVASVSVQEESLDLQEIDEPSRPMTPELQITGEASSPAETPDHDPTLPQHRPNEETPLEVRGLSSSELDESLFVPMSVHSQSDFQQQQQTLPAGLRLQPNGHTSFPAPSSVAASSPDAEATAPKMPPSPIQPLPQAASSSAASLPRRHGPTLPPSTLTLSRWAYLNQIEREAKERGGNGAKLSFEEFSRRMAADRGRRLAFIASWIEMASF